MDDRSCDRPTERHGAPRAGWRTHHEKEVDDAVEEEEEVELRLEEPDLSSGRRPQSAGADARRACEPRACADVPRKVLGEGVEKGGK